MSMWLANDEKQLNQLKEAVSKVRNRDLKNLKEIQDLIRKTKEK